MKILGFEIARHRLARVVAFGFAASLLVLSATGCGGGGAGGSSPTVSAAGTGSLSLTVKWPARSRIIPSEANTIIVTVYPPGTGTPAGNPSSAGQTYVQTKTISRPAGSTASSSSGEIDGLAPTQITASTSGEYLLQIEAYNAASPTSLGSPLAYGFVNASVVAGQTTVVNATLASTLTQLEIQGVPARAVGTAGANAPFYVNLNGQLSLSPITSVTPPSYPRTSIPLNASTPGFSTVLITPLDAEGNVLLLAPTGSSSTTSTSIFSVAGGSGGVIAIQTPSSTTTALPTGQTTPSFSVQSTGNEGGDSFTVTYNDDSTVVSFPVPVSATADVIPWVSLTLDNTPPDFDGSAPLNVTASATISETANINGTPTTYSYTATPTTTIPTLPSVSPTGWPSPLPSAPAPVVYGSGKVTFNFYNVSNHQHGYIYNYSLSGLTTGGGVVPFKSAAVTSPTTTGFPGAVSPATYPPSVAVRNAGSDAMLLSAFPSSVVTLAPANPAVPTSIPVTATFGSTSYTFPANLFTVGAGTDMTTGPASGAQPPYTALTFSQYVTQSAPTGYPLSLSTLTPIWMLDFYARTGTVPLGMQDRNSSGATIGLATTGTLTVKVSASAGNFAGGAG